MHKAAGNPRLAMVQLLLQSGADVNCRNNIGATALDLALLYRDNTVASLLKQHGAVKGLPEEDRSVDRSTLKRKLTLNEAEAEFGGSEAWHSIIAQMQIDDELWTYSTSTDSWNALRGQAGLLLIHDGKMVDGIVTEMN